jgi:hypothetical protein
VLLRTQTHGLYAPACADPCFERLGSIESQTSVFPAEGEPGVKVGIAHARCRQLLHAEVLTQANGCCLPLPYIGPWQWSAE